MLGFLKRKRQEDDLRKLVSMLVERKMDPGCDFRFLCSSLRTRRARLENMLYDIVGMSGDEIMLHLQCRNQNTAD